MSVAVIGETLKEKYRIEKLLGAGGMGDVYLATCLAMDAPVAVKALHCCGTSQAEVQAATRQFLFEARLLHRLHHPRLPHLHDFFEIDGHQYLVMDVVEGQTLSDYLTTHGPLPESTLLDWALELCDVLGYLHRQLPPVIFRDLKPANIMVDRDGHLKLIDFGIAKTFDRSRTRTGARGVGSAGFAAPEQYNACGTDARTDIYALGATLYCLLTCEIPPPSLELAFGHAVLPPLKALRPDVSPRVVESISWMMGLHQNHRPSSIQEVQKALEEARTAIPARAARPMQKLVRSVRHLVVALAGWMATR